MAICMDSPLSISTSEEEQGPVTESISSSSSSSPSPLCESSEDELQDIAVAPPAWKKRKRMLKQLSMRETPGDIAWERRRRQILQQERRRSSSSVHDSDDLTDEDLNELKGCIELGFGFNEEDGQTLCNTLPALDLYFAVNRQISPSPVSTPHCHSRGSALDGPSLSFGSRIITADSDSWKICSPGDD